MNQVQIVCSGNTQLQLIAESMTTSHLLSRAAEINCQSSSSGNVTTGDEVSLPSPSVEHSKNGRPCSASVLHSENGGPCASLGLHRSPHLHNCDLRNRMTILPSLPNFT